MAYWHGEMQITVVLQKQTICKVQYNSHTEILFTKLEILKIKDQFEYEITLFMNKHKQNKLPSSFDNNFTYNHEIQNRFTTRLSHFYIQRCHSTFARKLPLFEFPQKIGNKWSYCTHIFTSQSKLKRQLKGEIS